MLLMRKAENGNFVLLFVALPNAMLAFLLGGNAMAGRQPSIMLSNMLVELRIIALLFLFPLHFVLFVLCLKAT